MKTRHAFTLLEVLLTILIIGMIVGFLFPDLEKLMFARKLTESSERLRSLIIMCRSRSMHEGVRYRLQFPGTPDPLDRNAERDIDVPFETLQPEVFRQDRPLDFPDSFAKVEEDWTTQQFLSDGVRCVAAYVGVNFDETSGSPIVGPTITEGKREFCSLTFNPDGTCDQVTFRLTDLSFDTDPAKIEMTRVLDLIVDGRTGQTWFQRALLVEEMEVLAQYNASPIMHMDFNSPDPITEANILLIQHDAHGVPTEGKAPAAKESNASEGGAKDAAPAQ
jgi:prepilin-type N-terminal cleavage/methylation domain-containing protein